jgi:hypothetical protein
MFPKYFKPIIFNLLLIGVSTGRFLSTVLLSPKISPLLSAMTADGINGNTSWGGPRPSIAPPLESETTDATVPLSSSFTSMWTWGAPLGTGDCVIFIGELMGDLSTQHVKGRDHGVGLVLDNFFCDATQWTEYTVYTIWGWGRILWRQIKTKLPTYVCNSNVKDLRLKHGMVYFLVVNRIEGIACNKYFSGTANPKSQNSHLSYIRRNRYFST